jgi:putative nucleotidyltransferase with HDIG domain
MKYKAQPCYDAETQISKLTRIATVLGLKDPYTREHASRVAIYARRLAECIGLNATAVENIRLGGLLHDIGKIGLSTKILSNTHNPLSGDMLAEVRLHPLMGVAILNDFDLPVPVIDIVQYHHEKMDGSGYPFGLKGNQIPLGAKIIRVADCFDAITTDRPYQQRKSWIEALAILRRISGTDLSLELVKTFIVDIKENGLALNPTRLISIYSPVVDRRLMKSSINGFGE